MNVPNNLDHYTTLGKKDVPLMNTSFLGQFVSCEGYEVLWIRAQEPTPEGSAWKLVCEGQTI